MSLLFDTPLIDGLHYDNNVIDAAEERALIDRLSSLDLAPFRFQGWLGNRKTQNFGWRYDFDDASFTPGQDIPDWLHPLRERAAVFAGLGAQDFVQSLVARYDAGAGIGWHRDRDVFDEVVGFSLGTPAILRFRRRTDTGFKRTSLGLEPRSAYLLSGPARHEWQHSISPGELLRFSITFRTLSSKGGRIAAAR
jgi:alkylated DNA repair protein (DNA oxidative demethylase)